MQRILVSSIAVLIKYIFTSHARRDQVILMNDIIFEVFLTEIISSYFLWDDDSICECVEWQMSSIPCDYALAISFEVGIDLQIYAKLLYNFRNL